MERRELRELVRECNERLPESYRRMIPATIRCREFVEFLDDYLSGVLGEPRQGEFNLHLSMCPSCVAYMKTYQETIRMGKAAMKRSDEPVPEDVPEALVRAILMARKKR